MKRNIIIAAVIVLLIGLGLWAKSSIPSDAQKTEQTQQQTEEQDWETKAEKGEKGKMEMSGEVPPAPGDEEAAQKAEQKEELEEEPVQKQTQKQSQKS